MRLDEERLEALRSWGEKLRQSGGEESAAVGRAILMLVEEIDRLHIELWHARMAPSGEGAEAGSEEPVASSLHARLQGVLRRGRAETEADSEPSRQAWIGARALRRQK